MTRITIWNEGVHERTQPGFAELYPEGIHGAIAEGLRDAFGSGAIIRTATLDEPEHGLSDAVLDQTDVLLWWGHLAHARVSDEIVERVHQRVLSGMGLLVLHSGHYSKIFTRLLGTTCSLLWRNDAAQELVWTIDPTHPIADGVPNPIVIANQETYGEFFDIPIPDELVFVSSFTGGEVFRSGVTYRRGKGKIFYFSPGDQEYPVYFHPAVRRVLRNGVIWATPAPADRQVPDVSNPPQGWFLEGTANPA